MKATFSLLAILILANVGFGQAFGSSAEIITVFSQNDRFYLKSIPYDSEFPSLRGKTLVFEKGSSAPIYVFERGFDSVHDESNNLVLSNDGQVILFIIPWGANEEKDGLKSVSIYKKGQLVQSYTKAEITGCDLKKERCDLIYNNHEAVVDEAGSNRGTKNYKKAFKNGVDEKEKFLSNFPIFSFDDIVYITDSKRNVHQLSLKELGTVRSESFDNLYDQIKSKGRSNKIELNRFDAPMFLKFPKLKSGKDPHENLAAFLGMKTVDNTNKNDEQYRSYQFSISGLLSRDGSFEIEEIDAGSDLPKDKILEFFRTNSFDPGTLPKEAEKWFIINEYFYLRNRDDNAARREKQQQEIKVREEQKKRLTAETIEGRYIPKDLGECFLELDKLLTVIDRKEIEELKTRDGMNSYHMGLGMWMRNNWGLWGGSRLQKYFSDRGVRHPDNMSGVILEFYFDWLHGNKEAWREWERKTSNKAN